MTLNIETRDTPEMIKYTEVMRYLYRNGVLWIFRACDPAVITIPVDQIHRTEETKSLETSLNRTRETC